MTAYLNDKTTNQEFLDFVVDDIHNVVVSAVTQNGMPSAQVCDMLMNKNGKLYMTTSIKNPFFASLLTQPEVLINGYKGGGTMDSCGFSIKAKIKNLGQQYLQEVFKKNPYLYEIYEDNLEEAMQDLRILELTPIRAGFLDHRFKPAYMRNFVFGQE